MKKAFILAAVMGAFAVSVSASLAGPLMMGPAVMPLTPKVTVVPTVTSRAAIIQSKVLSSYRQLRTFWLSRAIVR